MKKIKLTQGRYTLVDNEDFERVNQHKWYFSNGYAARKFISPEGKRLTTCMHRFIINPGDDSQVDHKNRNGLDNRRVNLRICSRSQNQLNRPLQANNTSGFKGVSWNKHSWRAIIWLNQRMIYIGSFKSKVEAAIAYNNKAKQLFGEFAFLNII